MATRGHGVFRGVWWSANFLLLVAVLGVIYSSAWEFSVRRYLDGFSDAIVPDSEPAERQVEAILDWMRKGPPRLVAADPSALPARDPQTTLNYQQLLSVCGTATNAFLNLARSNGLSARRLLLLTSSSTTKHVVAEVLIDGRWVVVDPVFRLLMRDRNGRFLTRDDLRNPATLAEATSVVPHYPQEYTYERFAHVRLARMPVLGFSLRWILDTAVPNWQERFDSTLLLERESFFVLSASATALLFLLLLRILLGWYADHKLHIPRFQLRLRFLQAGTIFFRAPEIK